MKGFELVAVLLSRASWRNVGSFCFKNRMNRLQLNSSESQMGYVKWQIADAAKCRAIWLLADG